MKTIKLLIKALKSDDPLVFISACAFISGIAILTTIAIQFVI
jgi:hypothetical protein